MLNLMRKHAGSWMIKVLLGAVTVTFIFFGGLYRDQRKQKVATVNGAAISYDEYAVVLKNLQDQAHQRFGNSMSDEILKMMKLEQQALDRLINQRVLLAEAEKLDFRVSNRELADSIRKMKIFQAAGKFDNIRYERLLKRNNLNREEFEAEQKGGLLIEKLQSFISGNVKVSDLEVLEWYKWNGATVNIDYVLFEPDKYMDVNPTDKEISDYYEKHKTEYKTEIKVRTRYIYFDPADYRKNVTVTEQEIKDYYESNPEDFLNPKTVEARHILFRVSEDAKPEIVEKARKKALDVLKMAQDGKDFIELAKKYSEGPTKDKGGYLGTFKKETMVKSFADQAFNMKPGEISDLVRTQYGWHIIKVDKVNEESTTPFEKTEKTIRKRFTDERANALAGDEAQEVYDASFEGDDLIRTAKDKNLIIEETDFFTSRGPGEGVKHQDKFAEAAFDLENLEISEILDFGDLLCILQVIDKIPEKISELIDVTDEVRNDLVKEMQDQNALKDAKDYLAALKAGGPMADKSGKVEIKVNNTGLFKRSGSIPKIGYEREISETAFKLSSENRFPEDVNKGQKGYYVFRFRERKEPPAVDFEKERESIRKKLLQQKKNRVVEEWLEQVKKQNEIIIESAFLE